MNKETVEKSKQNSNKANKEVPLEELKPLIEKMKRVPWWYKLAPSICQNTTWFLGKAMFIIFNRLKIYGKENLKKAAQLKRKQKGGVVFVANHISELDPMLVVSGIFPWSALSPMFYVSRPMHTYKQDKDLKWRRFIYGPTLFYLWGAHPLIKGTKDYKISLTRHIELLKRGVSLCIFPQGRMSIGEGTGIDEVKGGAGYLAHHVASVVVPVAIKGTRDITMKEFFTFKRKIEVHYGEPIDYEKILELAKECEQKNPENKYKCITQYFADKIKQML